MRLPKTFSSLLGAAVILLPYWAFAQPSTGEWDKVALTALRAAAVRVDITPASPVQLGGYSERTGDSTGVHDPLMANLVVFDDGKARAVLAGVDAIMILQDWADRIHAVIQEKTGIAPEYVLLNASHTHGAPHPLHEPEYTEMVAQRLGEGVQQAIAALRPVSIGYGEGEIDFSINRRTVDATGKASSELNPQGVNDRRIKVLRIDAGDEVEPLAVIVHAVCHPNVFRGENTQVSADFAGIGRTFMEKNFQDKTVGVFLQGCSGDIRSNMPPVEGGWRNGSAADMAWCALSLGAEATKVAARLRVREELLKRGNSATLRVASRQLLLEADAQKLATGKQFRDRVEEGKIPFTIRVLAIGDIVLIALPGEPVVEYGLGIEADLTPLGKQVVVLGYGAGDNGYVPAEHMIDEGGYEAEGLYTHGVEEAVRAAVKAMVEEMFAVPSP